MSSCISPGVISSSTHAGNKTTNAQLRKIKKPLIERRRRERINECLIQLKTLVLEAMNKDESRYSKMEKADILEMTVSHLKSLQKRLSHTSSSSFLTSHTESMMSSPSVKPDPLYRMESSRFQQDLLTQYLTPTAYKETCEQKISSPLSNGSQNPDSRLMNESRVGNSNQDTMVNATLNQIPRYNVIPEKMINASLNISPKSNSSPNTQYPNNISQIESLSPVDNIKCRSDFPTTAAVNSSNITVLSQMNPLLMIASQPNLPSRDITCSVSSTTEPSIFYQNCGNRVVLLNQVQLSSKTACQNKDSQVRDLYYSPNMVFGQPGAFYSTNQNFLCSIKNDVWRPW